jgi:glycerol-3-phosphate acyltransferase PlsX
MSGDNPPREYVTGSLHALGHDAGLRALLVGQADQIEPHLAGLTDSVRERLEIVPAATVVAMGDTPREAIRRKKDSSMRIAIDLV